MRCIRTTRFKETRAAMKTKAPDRLFVLGPGAGRMRRFRLGGLLTLHQPRTQSIQPLEDLFEPFVWSPGDFRTLPIDELAEVLADERRGDLFLGGYADRENQTLTLVRGDLQRLSVPLSMFLPS